MTVLDDLKWRGLLADCTDEIELTRRLQSGPITLYCGFDPTADSLHVGNLVPLLTLRRFQLHGHHPIALAGGATGSIGDPSGRTQERQLLTRELLSHNIARVKGQLARLLDFETAVNPARLLDNADWMAPITYLDFLREVGKYFSVNQMIAKESVRARMEDRDVGISYTEFSYMLLQAFDFCHLRQTLNCELQIGATDQWGNITAGTDLIRKKLSGATAWGLTHPLLTKADGTKYGKTAAGAVWLDAERTSPYRFYQFFIQSDDADVLKLLRMLTLLSREEVEALAEQHAANPGGRAAHRALAQAVTDLIHGEAATREAQHASGILFGGGVEGISENTFRDIIGEVPTARLDRPKLDGVGMPLVELLVQVGLCPSKGQARKDIESGGIYVHNLREASASRLVTLGDLLFGRHLLLRKGKRNYVIVTVD